MSRNGFAIAEVLIAALLLSIVTAGTMSVMKSALQSTGVMGKRNDVEAVRRDLLESVSCPQTLGSLAVSCPASGVGPPLVLRDANGNPVTQSGVLLASGLLAGSAPYTDQIYLKVVCDRAQQTLTVRLAKGNGTSFLRDPTSGSDFDFRIAPNPLFGGITPTGVAAPKLCREYISGLLGPTVVCPAGKLMQGIDYSTTPPTPICQPQLAGNVTCPSGQFLVGMNFNTNPPTPNCQTPPAPPAATPAPGISLTAPGNCPAGQYVQGLSLAGTSLVASCGAPPSSGGGGGGPPALAASTTCGAGQYLKGFSINSGVIAPNCQSFVNMFTVRSERFRLAVAPDGYVADPACQPGEVPISGGGRCPDGRTARVGIGLQGVYTTAPGSTPLSTWTGSGWTHWCSSTVDVTNQVSDVVCMKAQ